MSKGEDVSAFIAALPHRRRDEIVALRSLILAAVPGLSERIKWNAPSFGRPDDRVTMRLQPGDRLELIFHRGVKPKTTSFAFADPTGLLDFVAPDRAVLRIETGTLGTRRNEIADLVKRWIDATA